MVVAGWGDRKGKGMLMYLEVTACCVGLIAMAWTPWFWGACVLVALVGSTSIGGFWPVSSSLMQLTTAPEMRGRMMAMMQMAPVFHFLGAWPLTLAGAGVRVVDCHQQRGDGVAGHIGGGLALSSHGAADEPGLTTDGRRRAAAGHRLAIARPGGRRA